MALTDTAIRNVKPKDKPYKMGDTLGLFLLVQPSGGKLWRLKYRIDGKEKKLGLGTYPDVGLAQARSGRDDARKLLTQGLDPALDKTRRKLQARVDAGNTFDLIAEEFIAKRTAEGWSAATIGKAYFLLKHLNPMLGEMQVSDIVPTDILAVLKQIEKRGKLETARRALQFASGIFRYAVATARLASDPTSDLRGALIAPKPKH